MATAKTYRIPDWARRAKELGVRFWSLNWYGVDFSFVSVPMPDGSVLTAQQTMMTVTQLEVLYPEHHDEEAQQNPRGPWAERVPAVVSLERANLLAERLSQFSGMTFRLPTHEEWVYLARARSNNIYAGDARFFTGTEEQQHPENPHRFGAKDALPVGERAPNDFGLFDMSGLEWEWTCTATPPIGMSSGRILGPGEDDACHYPYVIVGGSVRQPPVSIFQVSTAFTVQLVGLRLVTRRFPDNKNLGHLDSAVHYDPRSDFYRFQGAIPNFHLAPVYDYNGPAEVSESYVPLTRMYHPQLGNLLSKTLLRTLLQFEDEDSFQGANAEYPNGRSVYPLYDDDKPIVLEHEILLEDARKLNLTKLYAR